MHQNNLASLPQIQPHLMWPVALRWFGGVVDLMFDVKGVGECEKHHPCFQSLWDPVLIVWTCWVSLTKYFIGQCYTGDILTLVPWMEFEYFPEKYIDYCYTCGNGGYLKMELDFTIVYLPKTKE